MAGLFQVLWGEEGGKFAEAKPLTGTDEKPLVIPVDDESQITRKICTRPFAIDWDADGDLDLVAGNFEGSFFVFEGKGSGQFEGVAMPLKSGGQVLRISGGHSDPFVIDWDGDGDLDLLSGSTHGDVQLALNTAGKGKPPVLSGFKRIAEPLKRDGSHSSRVWADDVNGDGRLDLLVGDAATLRTPANGLSKEESEKKLAEVEAKMAALRPTKISEEGQPDEAFREQQQALYEERSEYVTEEMTGFVWLLLQKAEG